MATLKGRSQLCTGSGTGKKCFANFLYWQKTAKGKAAIKAAKLPKIKRDADGKAINPKVVRDAKLKIWNKEVGVQAKKAGFYASTGGKLYRTKPKGADNLKGVAAAAIGLARSEKSGAKDMLAKLTGGLKGKNKSAIKKWVCDNPTEATKKGTAAQRKAAAKTVCEMLS